MRTSTLTATLAALLTALLLAACSIETSGPMGTIVPDRTGPEFEVAFPDPRALLTTADIPATGKLLDTIPLPATPAHHDALRHALAQVDAVDSAHLVLLTEAVALPHRTAWTGWTGGIGRTGDHGVTITSTNGRAHVHSRAKSEFSHVVDELLIAGARKLSDIGPQSFGRLVGRTMTEEATIELANLLLEKSDDGSDSSLQEILDAIPFAGMREELCVTVLLPRNRLQDTRADIAIRSMSFDSNRTKLIAAIYATLDRIDPQTLLRHVGMQSFDSGRIAVARLGVPLLDAIDGETAAAVMKTASFDSGRTQMLDALQPKLRLASAGSALVFVRMNSFDSGRQKVVQRLLRGSFPTVTEADLLAFVKAQSFDSGRQKMVGLLREHFDGEFSRQGAERLLRSFSFDSGRMQFLASFRSDLQRMSKEDRFAIARLFSFDSERNKAIELLAR